MLLIKDSRQKGPTTYGDRRVRQNDQQERQDAKETGEVD